MEMKLFNKITKEIFANFGFSKDKKYYMLKLKDITLFVWLDYYCGLRSIDDAYYFSNGGRVV